MRVFISGRGEVSKVWPAFIQRIPKETEVLGLLHGRGFQVSLRKKLMHTQLNVSNMLKLDAGYIVFEAANLVIWRPIDTSNGTLDQCPSPLGTL